MFVGMMGESIDGSGQSSSTLAGRDAATKLFNKWRESLGLPFIEDMEEEDVCSESLMSQFAYFLVKDYKKNDNENLKLNTVLSTISNLMNLQSRRFQSKSGKEFFQVLTRGQSGADHWYNRVRHGIKTAIRRRSIEQGNKVVVMDLLLYLLILYCLVFSLQQQRLK